MKSRIPLPFDPDSFRDEGHKLVDILSDYLREVTSGKSTPVLPWNEPDELANLFSFDSAGGSNEPFDDFIKRIITYSNHLHNPRYIGHQVTSPLPLTALAHFCTSLLNNGAAIYEMGPVNMAMEKNVIKFFGSLIGYTSNYDGIFTHGGSAGNLTAILAARQTMSDYNVWEEGIKDKCRMGFMISEQSHYSIGRNVRIMGIGGESIIKIPHDAKFRMRTSQLGKYKRDAEKNGIRIIGVVANSCSTATGSYDDLEKIADFCEKHNLWMHVDGAHGMGVLFSEKFKGLVKGIERADSVVIDFHKMFLVPALGTLVLFKNGERSYETFAQKASYLFKKTQQNVWYNSAIRTLECTKSAIGIIVYTALKYYSGEYYRNYIESRYDLAERFASLILSNSEMELALKPDANIVCFRYKPKGHADTELNALNSTIRETIIKEGSFYIVQTEINDKIWIRTTILNPITSENDLKELIKRIIEIGSELKSIRNL